MPDYRTYGARDDRIAKDGDVGFIGFNNRLRPDQLQPGMLADAQNVRLDRNGEAVARNGVDLLVAPIVVGSDALTLPFYLPTLAQEGDGTTAILDDDAVNAIYGSCAYSDPAIQDSQYIIIAANTKAVAIDVSDGTTTDINYVSGTVVSNSVDMLQAFNKVFIFRDGQAALEWDGDFNNDFELVESGAYSQPTQLSPSAVDITDGKATATFSSLADLNGTTVGHTIEIEAIGNSGLVVGERYVVAERDDSVPSISFFVQHADVQNASNVIFQRDVSVGLGFTHMPAPPYAIYHQRRLVMPFNYTVNDAEGSFTRRDSSDEVIASDILDSDTYDQIYAQYRFNAGTADFVVGLHSFAEDTLLVFNRNSIHAVKNSSDVANASVQLLTNEVGCLARKSIVQVGNRVIFLSDNGVYSTEFIDEYNLRGTGTPLSEPIDATIKRINSDYADKSVGVYFDNRYYLAVPLDGATENNAILIFNFLNKQWESIDTVKDDNYHNANLILAGRGSNRGVYSINNIGGVHKIDSRTDGYDRIVTQIGGSEVIKYSSGGITTRQYTLGSIDRKKWKDFDFHIQSQEDGSVNADFLAEVENPDSTLDLGSLQGIYGDAGLRINEDVSVRGRIGGLRGYGIQFTINNTGGRPRIRSVGATGSISMRSTNIAI